MLLVTLSQSLGFAAESLPLPKETPWDLWELVYSPRNDVSDTTTSAAGVLSVSRASTKTRVPRPPLRCRWHVLPRPEPGFR